MKGDGMPSNPKSILKFILLFTIGFFLICGQKAFATPMLYTFEGENRQILTDELGLIANAGIDLGSKVAYTFLVDFDRLGYSISYGDIIYMEDNDINDYFFNNLVSTPFLQSPNFPSCLTYESYIGQNYDGTIVSGNLSVYFNQYSTGETRFIGVSDDGHVQDWQIGQIVSGWEYFIGPGDNNASKFRSLLTLTKIDTAPVPEPSTIFLLGIGLLGLVAIKSRKKKS